MASHEEFGLLHGRVGDWYAVNVTGELDLSTTSATAEAVEAFRASDCRNLVLDLRGVSFADPVGARFLLAIAAICQERSGEFVVYDPQPSVLRVLAFTRVAGRMTIRTRGGRHRAGGGDAPGAGYTRDSPPART